MRASILAAAAAALTAAQPLPKDVLQRAISQYLSKPYTHDFWSYSYGATIMLTGAYQAVTQFGQNWTAKLDGRLSDAPSGWLQDPSSVAGRILANVTVPWNAAVGDGTGLYPISFLAQMDLHGLDKTSLQWQVAVRTAEKYIVNWPIRLADGTFARHSGFPGRTTSDAVLWNDDGFMGLSVLNRLAMHGAPNSATYVNVSANMTITYAKYMADPVTGLYFHAVDYTTGAHSCCLWGRANGWQLMSAMETLMVLPTTAEQYPGVLKAFNDHCAAFLKVQDMTDGRWHQVLDHPETYLETSITAMAVHAFAQGVLHGWLDKATYDASIRAGWKGVAGAVNADGTINNICIGTGIYNTVAEYAARPTTYNQAAPGIGSVFWAGLSYDTYVAKFGTDGAAATA